MSKQYKVVVCTVCLAAGALCFNVSAQPSGDGPAKFQESVEGKRGMRMEKKKKWFRDGEKGNSFEKKWKDLGLTPEQQQQIDDQRKQNMEEAKALKEKLYVKKGALRAELQKDPLDMEKVNAIHAEIKALNAQREDNRLKGILQMREILTAEQFQQLHEKMKEKGMKFKEGKHPVEDEG